MLLENRLLQLIDIPICTHLARFSTGDSSTCLGHGNKLYFWLPILCTGIPRLYLFIDLINHLRYLIAELTSARLIYISPAHRIRRTQNLCD